MKQCTNCGETKEFSLFTKSKNGKYGYKSQCKACVAQTKKEKYRTIKEAGLYDPAANKNSMLKKLYGIGIDEYNSMLEMQKHKCAICSTHIDVFIRKLAVDHDHKTGVVRGLLCHHCNTAIGLLKEDSNLIRKAASYIEHHNIKD